MPMVVVASAAARGAERRRVLSLLTGPKHITALILRISLCWPWVLGVDVADSQLT